MKVFPSPDKTVCWLSPSEYIFKTQLENLAKAAAGYVPENIRFYTYAKLMIQYDYYRTVLGGDD